MFYFAIYFLLKGLVFKNLSDVTFNFRYHLQEEFQLALFKTNKKESLFADRVLLSFLFIVFYANIFTLKHENLFPWSYQVNIHTDTHKKNWLACLVLNDWNFGCPPFFCYYWSLWSSKAIIVAVWHLYQSPCLVILISKCSSVPYFIISSLWAKKKVSDYYDSSGCAMLPFCAYVGINHIGASIIALEYHICLYILAWIVHWTWELQKIC